MTYADLARKLVNCGCEFDRQARGSHEVWRNRAMGRRATVPNHGRRDLAPGTVRAIIHNLGIGRRDFDAA